MTNTTKNAAPIGSMWMGKDADGISITVVVESAQIPGNDFRHVKITSRSHSAASDAGIIGAKWFKRATRIG